MFDQTGYNKTVSDTKVHYQRYISFSHGYKTNGVIKLNTLSVFLF